VSFKAGEAILTAETSVHRLMLLLEGVATYTITDGAGKTLSKDTVLHSGQTFDVGLMNVLGGA